VAGVDGGGVDEVKSVIFWCGKLGLMRYVGSFVALM
jgi:hypothetical protein